MLKQSFPSQVFLAWTAFQRRQVSMSGIVGFECWFIPVPQSGRLVKALNYLRLFLVSIVRLWRVAPDVVWVQLPQVPALWAALMYRGLFQKPIRVIADCHNSQLSVPWCSFPLALWSLGKANAILVHNEVMFERAREIGWPMDKVRVLEDVPALGEAIAPVGLAASHITAPKPWILFPGSFAPDEPIDEVLEAACLAPELTFIVTGRPERARQNGHEIDNLPPNVVLPGFLSLELFDDLLREADVVMGLTKEEGIQLSVCNEALGFGKPLVTSNTQILNKLFGKAAVLVDPRDPESIANGCRSALVNASEMASASQQLANERLESWKRFELRAVQELAFHSAIEGDAK